MKTFTSPITLIKKSIDIFIQKENLEFLIQIYLPMGFLSTVSLFFTYVPTLYRFFSTFAGSIVMGVFNLLFILTGVFVNLAGIIAIIKITDGKKSQVRGVFKEVTPKYGKFILLTLAIYLIYALGLILLVIPFFIVITWFAFSKFIIVEKKIGIGASLVESRNLVKRYFWKVLGRILVFGLFSLLAQILLTLLPYGTGSIVFSLCGALFILPLFLFYREIVGEPSAE